MMSYYENNYILELMENYLENVELYGGSLIEGLSYTLHHLEHYCKEYPITLFLALELIEHESVKKVYTPNNQHQKDLEYWKTKCKISMMEHFSLEEEKLKNIVQKVISKNLDEILHHLT